LGFESDGEGDDEFAPLEAGDESGFEADLAEGVEGDFETLEGNEAWEADDEIEGFFGKIGGFFKKAARGVGKLARKGIKILGPLAGRLFKVLAPVAAKIVGGAIGGPAGMAIASAITSGVLKESEAESAEDVEQELDTEAEDFVEAGGDVEAYEAMEAYAAEAAEAETEVRANAATVRFLGAATRLFRRNRRVRAAIPSVLRAAIALVKTFRGNSRTRWAVKVVPLIVRRTLTRLARTRRITRKAIVQAMARETAWVLANRSRAIASLKRHHSARRRTAVRRRRRRVLREESFAEGL